MELATDIHHVSGHCWQGFQDQQSKVMVICVWIHIYVL